MKIALIGLNSKFSDSNLALYYLREALPPRTDLEVDLLELTVNAPFLATVAAIAGSKADVLAFSAYIWNKETLQKLLPLLRRILPETVIVLGGPEATFSPAAFPWADLILRGAAEALWPRLVRELLAGKSIEELGYLTEETGFVTDWPFPYREEDRERLQNRLIYYETSRGCPFHCSFCLSAAEKRMAFLPVERVKSDIDRLLCLEGRTIKFVDRTFNQPPERAGEILRYLLTQARPGITFHFELKGDLLTDELIGLLQAAPDGYFQVEIGIQSLNEQTLAAVGRRHDWQRLRQAVVRLLKKDNLHVHLDLIAGLPHETLSSFQSGFDAVWQLGCHRLQLGFLKVLPGTPLADTAQGYISLPFPPYEVLASPDLPFSDMEKIRQVEAVLEREYNSGRHPLALHWAAAHFPDGAFALFYRLSQRKKQPLADALQLFVPMEEGFWPALLRYEAFMQGKKHPVTVAEEKAAVAFLHEEGTPARYFPHLIGERPQDIYKKIRLLQLDFDFTVKDGRLLQYRKKPSRYLFDYSRTIGVRRHPWVGLLI